MKKLSTLNFHSFTRRKKHSPFSAGFTLVELLVSLTLFTVVVLASMGSVLVINNAAHQVDAMRTVLDNLNFAVDSMTRTVHTAEAISCGDGSFDTPDSPVNCNFANGGSNDLKVLSTIGLAEGSTDQIEYFVQNNQLKKRVNRGSPLSLTDPKINIQKLRFYVSGATLDDAKQPQVTMVIQGEATVGQDVAPFTIQTLVAVRNIEQ